MANATTATVAAASSPGTAQAKPHSATTPTAMPTREHVRGPALEHDGRRGRREHDGEQQPLRAGERVLRHAGARMRR